MSVYSRAHDLTLVIANAINARAGRVGASSFDLAVINGFTGTQAQYLAGYGTATMTDAQRAALTGTDLWDGRMVTASDTGITWRYCKATTNNFWGASTPARWRRWDSDWFSANWNVNAFNGGYGASNGWVTNGGWYRFHGGKLCFTGNIIVNGAGAINSQINFSFPIDPLTNQPFVAKTPNRDGSYTYPIDVYRQNQGGGVFALLAAPAGSLIYTGYLTANANLAATSSSSPFSWAQADILRWDIEVEYV